MKISSKLLIIFTLFTVISTGFLTNLRAEDVTIGIAKTGLFHGQVAIDGLNQMIYYFEKLVNTDDPDKVFQAQVRATLDNAMVAKEAFEAAILFAEETVKPKKINKSPEVK